MNDPALTICPKGLCAQRKWGKGKVQRMLGTGAGLLFKGSGFYITDYRSEGYKSAAKKDSAGGETKTADSAKKTDSKPAATEKSKPAKKSE
jgi:predicted nucleic acid-binding Zn ribbon protein